MSEENYFSKYQDEISKMIKDAFTREQWICDDDSCVKRIYCTKQIDTLEILVDGIIEGTIKKAVATTREYEGYIDIDERVFFVGKYVTTDLETNEVHELTTSYYFNI